MISSSFRKSSLAELSKIAYFKIADEFVATLVIESKEERLAEKLLKSNPIFIYNIFKLKGKSKIEESDYLNSIYRGMSKTLPKKGGIKIECFDVNCKTKYSAKDIEVYLGQKLEKEGYDVNIITPDFLVYLVLINMRCYVGYSDYKKLKKKFVNPERHYHPLSKDAVSRSELKLVQAFDDFGIKGKGLAIDLGAAPGGWSHFLAGSGFKVIAIDNGDLDYKKLGELGMKVKTITESQAILKEDLKKNNIIHIKANAKKTSLKGMGKATILIDDMNMVPKESAELVLSFSRILAKNAKLIFTIKCVDRNAEKHISNATQALGKEFRINAVRVFPSNRQELTLYATYRGKVT